MHTFFENILAAGPKCTEDLGAETTIADTIETGWYSLAEFHACAAIGIVGGAATNDVITLRIYEGSDATGGGSATLSGKTDTFTATATNHFDILKLEVKGEELSDGFTFVCARMSGATDVDAACNGAVCLEKFNPRFAAV